MAKAAEKNQAIPTVTQIVDLSKNDELVKEALRLENERIQNLADEMHNSLMKGMGKAGARKIELAEKIIEACVSLAKMRTELTAIEDDEKKAYKLVAVKLGISLATATTATAKKGSKSDGTVNDFIVGLLANGDKTSKEINQAAETDGRKLPSVGQGLLKLKKDGKITAKKIKGKQGSTYSLATA